METSVAPQAWLTNLSGDQFGSGFCQVNPNAKIPALFDRSTRTRVFESGSILVYLCDTYDLKGQFLPLSGPERTETLNWVFWQVGSGGYLGGGFGHFWSYARRRPIRLCAAAGCGDAAAGRR